ncbi:MAG: TraR/DksA family transcriptional regulator [Candidatus Omnitrophica bacterium]|nr:TraR/DksA family transcriptional regulator [Candidatus Omnitrophota bacterium]
MKKKKLVVPQKPESKPQPLAINAPVRKELEPYRTALLEIRRKIAGGLEHLEEGSFKKSQRDSAGDLSGYSLHMADVATDNFDMEFNIGLASNEQQYLNMIDVALHKIKEGTFGTCENCSKPIPQKRLMAIPHARLCIPCQEEEEKNSKRL